MQRLLVIEDSALHSETSVRAFLAREKAFHCESVDWGGARRETLPDADVHGIVAVAVPNTGRAIEHFEWFRHHSFSRPTLAVLPQDADPALVGAVAHAADDFLYSPIRGDELRLRLGRLLGAPHREVDEVRESLLREMAMMQLVGADPAFVRALEQVPRFAASDMPVLITGETGTGKEVFARAIHHMGRRRPFPFIPIDCGAMPDHLFENEMFGHARGAFTDAHRDQKGLVAIAEGGTLLVDEVDSLSMHAQAKLLRFLQEKTFRPLGSDRFVRADVNVIAATNRDLEACVREKQFRADLYFRLNVLTLRLPRLRDRRADIPLLARHFLEELRNRGETQARSFTVAALQKLEGHPWPGNVRELYNVVRSAAVLSEREWISPAAFPIGEAGPLPVKGGFRRARADVLATFERNYVEDLLRRHGGNVTRAAKEAEKERRAFGRLVKKYGIDRRRVA